MKYKGGMMKYKGGMMQNKVLFTAWMMLFTGILLAASCAQPAPTAKPAPAPAPAPAAKPAPAPAPAPAAKPAPAPAPAAKPAPAPAPAPKPAPAAKPTGTLRVGWGDFGTERFYSDSNTGAMAAVNGVFEWLVNLDANNLVIPMLAERWESTPDAKSWTFFLRKGVQFHDGWGEFTAEDVKFSIEQGGLKGSLNSRAVTWNRNLASIEIVNPYQVRLNFKASYVPTVLDASPPTGTIIMVSKKYVESVGKEKAGQRPIGTGPFKFVDHQVGQTITLEAVENHWRVTPGFKTVQYKLVSDPNTMVTMLKTGELDIASVAPSSIDELKAAGLKIEMAPMASAFYVSLGGQMPTRPNFDPKVPWVGDPKDPASLERAKKVRMALSLAVDREAILRNIFKGAGTLFAVPLFDAGAPWTDPKWKPIPYDPAQAKKLLAEAGYSNGLPPFDLWTYGMGGREELPIVAEAVAMMWQQIGVKANLRPTDSPGFRPIREKRQMVFAAATDAVPNVSPEPYTIYSNYFSTGGGSYFGVEDSRLDAQQAKILAEPDFNKRAELQKQWGQLMVDNNWIVPIAHKSLVWAVGPKVAKWTPMISQFFRNTDLAIPAK